MLPTVFFIPHEIAGVPVFGFGLLLGVWTLGSLLLLAWLAWRQGFTADTWAYVPLLLLVGAIIYWLLPALCQARGLPIRGFGTMVVVAIGAACGLAAWRARRRGLDPELILSLAFWMIVPGIVGARLFYVIEYRDQYWPVYQKQGLAAILVAMVNVSQGGLVVYGSLLGGLLGLLAFVRRYRLPLLAVCDLIAPSLVLGLAIGRIGCLANGCCYGGVCETPWAVTFPTGSPVHFHQIEHGQTFLHGLKIKGVGSGWPMIVEVQPGSAAEHQGLVPGQQITAINGYAVERVGLAASLLLRATDLSVKTEDRPRWVSRWDIEDEPAEDWPSRDRQARDAVRQGRAFLHGLKIRGDAEGRPLIAEVRPGSPPQRQGLKPKQRIAEINGQTVGSVEDAVAALEHASWISIATSDNRLPKSWDLQRPSADDHPVRPVHPTQAYSGINALLLCLVLLAYDPFRRRDGQTTLLLLLLYPITRFLLEVVRTDEAAVLHTGLSISQNISLAVLVFAVGLWFYLLRQPPDKAFG
ncbi:MAG: prolipoprotein diacylglyceryl transferase [Pirellulales bacterium]|nr:prolipoprotein diacylglyceryl transferase [Pirellulales bacterium]